MLIDYSRKTAGDPAERDREIGLALKLSSGGKKARKASDQKHTHNLFFFFFSSLRLFFSRCGTGERSLPKLRVSRKNLCYILRAFRINSIFLINIRKILDYYKFHGIETFSL